MRAHHRRRPLIRRPYGIGTIAATAAALVVGVLTPAASHGADPGAPPSGPNGPSSDAVDRIEHPAKVIARLSGEPAWRPLATGASRAPSEITATTKHVVAQRRSALLTAHAELAGRVRAAGIRTTGWTDLTDLVNAVAVTVDRSDLDRLAGMPGVTEVLPDRQASAHTTDSVPLVGAPQVWDTDDTSGNPVRGTGSVVAVIDTGIDYTHPDLGAGFGEGHKVVGGHDYVGDDDDPMDDNAHGTHVAGIIAGSGHDGAGIVGVAPDASLLAYKVLDARGTGYESDIIAALADAVAPDNPHRADVVNLSLGVAGDGTDPLGAAASMAVQMGIVVVASAGNAGPGASTMSSPAVADGVISVGASTSGISNPTATMTAPSTQRLQTFRAAFSANPPAEPTSGELVDVGSGYPSDYERVGSVQGKVVAYRASFPADARDVNQTMLDKAKLAEDRGAIAVLGHTSSGGPVLASTPPPDPADAPGTVRASAHAMTDGDPQRMQRLPVLGLKDGQWDELREHLADGPVTVRIGGEDLTDRLASFSSRGPTPRHAVGPDLVAPGVEILSTVPTNMLTAGVYRMSGTSMAAPHVAGAAALLRQPDRNAPAADLAARLIGTATGLDHLGPSAQGAGRLDVAAAAASNVFAEPSTLSFGLAETDAQHIAEHQTVNLHNSGDTDVSFRLSARSSDVSIGRVGVTPDTVTVPAGGDAKVTVRLSAGTPAADAELSGWLVARPTAGDAPTLRVPYLLSVQHLIIQASPDPSDGTTEAFVYSPGRLGEPPTLGVTAPDGSSRRVPLRLDHGSWYRGPITGEQPGTYRLTADAATSGGLRLTGTSAFEVVTADSRPGEQRWEPIGPNSAGGRLSTTGADPARIALTQYQRLIPWISGDSGSTWRQVPLLPVAGGYGDLVIDPGNPQVMWYGLQGGDQDPTYRGAVLRTEDGGKTWQRLDLPDVAVLALVGDPQGRVLTAVTPQQLLVSRDGGRSWDSYANPAGQDFRRAQFGGDDLYLSTFRAVWRIPGLVDGEPAPAEQVYTTADDVQLKDLVADSELVAVLATINTGDTADDAVQQVIGSTDSGANFSTLYTVPEHASLMVLHDGEIMIGTTDDHQYFSADHGVSWRAVPEPVNGDVEADFARLGDDRLLVSSPGAGLFGSSGDGADPQRIGVQGETVHDLAVTSVAGEPQLLAATDHEIYDTPLPTGTVTPATAEWGLSGSEAYVGRQVQQVQTAADPTVAWKILRNALGQFDVMRSDDGGVTWSTRGRAGEVPYDLAVDPDDPGRVVVPFKIGEYGLLLTADNGAHWRKVFHPQRFSTVAIDPADPDRLWLGAPDGLYRSDDFGETVHKVRDGVVTAIRVDGNRVIAAGDEIAVSRNGGRTFRVADTGGLPLRVADLTVTPNGRTLYAGTTGHWANGLWKTGRGVLRSTDGGRSWQNISGGLQNPNVVSLQVGPQGDWLYAGTVAGGAHRLFIG